MSNTAVRLRQALDARSISQADLSRLTGIGKSSISTYLTGEYEPKQKNIYRMAQALDVNEAWLMGADVPMERIQGGTIADNPISANAVPERQTAKVVGYPIPVLGDVAAGIPVEAVTDILDYEEISEAMAATGEFFGLRIKGASMEPRMLEGDVVIVRKQDTAETGDTAVVLVNGDSATVKRIKILNSGIQLIPTNPTYDPIFYTAQEVEQLPVRIIGKVVELRGKF